MYFNIKTWRFRSLQCVNFIKMEVINRDVSNFCYLQLLTECIFFTMSFFFNVIEKVYSSNVLKMPQILE